MLKIGHYQPVWFFLPNLAIGFFPWIVWLPQAIKKALCVPWALRSKNKIEIFLFLWAALIFVFFSFSKSKLIPYILPIFPPLAILTAHYLRTAFEEQRPQGVKIGYGCLLCLSVVFAIIFVRFPYHTFLPDPHTAKIALFLAAFVLVLGSLSAFVCAARSAVLLAFYLTVSTTSLVLLISLAAMPAIDTRSIAPLAQLLKARMQPGDEVVAYNQYFQDLPFYLQQRITILNWKNELRFGTEHQDTHEWMINNTTFWGRWYSKKRVFALMGTEEYQQFCNNFVHLPHYLVGKSISYVVISNRPT